MLVGMFITRFQKPAQLLSRLDSQRSEALRSIFTTALKQNAIASSGSSRTYETLAVNSVSPYVTHVEINRPEKRNAMNKVFWREIGECFNNLNDDKNCRAIVLSGAGKIFSAGLDLSDMQDIVPAGEEDIARKCRHVYKTIRAYQEYFSSLEKCTKPVICAIHSACIGAGTDLICAGDIRYCTADTYFQIKEVDIGMAADVGTLQRLPKIIGSESLVRELAFTGRQLHSDEAEKFGLVNRVFPDKSSMMEACLELAKLIASKSPVAVQGTKVQLLYARDHGVNESLEYQAVWNMSMLQSEDLMKSVMAYMSKSKAEYSDY